MPTNRDTAAAWQFHDATKYFVTGPEWADESFVIGTPARGRPAMGEQDPAIAPLPYKA